MAVTPREWVDLREVAQRNGLTMRLGDNRVPQADEQVQLDRWLSVNAPSVMNWVPPRRAIAALQIMLRNAGLEVGEVDGYYGAATRHALEAFKGRAFVRPPEEPRDIAVQWPKQSECTRYFGPVGENQASVQLPYKMKIAWDLKSTITQFSCNRKVVAPLTEVFTKTLEVYGQDKISQLGLDLFGGCLNVRKMRGGSSWSMHSWGIAVDLDPDRNQLQWGRDRARFARPEYEQFWQIVEATGATSLGRARNYDWMHFQYARL